MRKITDPDYPQNRLGLQEEVRRLKDQKFRLMQSMHKLTRKELSLGQNVTDEEFWQRYRTTEGVTP